LNIKTKWRQTIFDNFGGRNKKIFSNAFNLLLIRIISAVLLFCMSILFARVLGANDLGIYFYISSWMVVIGIPTGLGTREYLVRETAVLVGSNRKNELGKIAKWGSITIFKAYLILMIPATLVVWQFAMAESNKYLNTFGAAIPLVLITAQTGVRYAILRGLDKTVLAQIPESLIKPVLQIILVSVAWYYFDKMTPWSVMLVTTLCSAAALGVIIRFYAGSYKKTESVIRSAKEEKIWLRSSLPFMLISGLYLVNQQTDIIMLGSLGSAKETGIYKIASYLSEFISFFLTAMNISIAPTIAKLWHTGKIVELQEVITRSIRLITLITLPLTGILLFFSDWILLLFGREFIQGGPALKVLCLSQFFNTSMGSVGLILNMCNHESLTAWGVGLSAILNILLNWYLIPLWGLNGAATASAASLIAWNFLLLYAVRRKTGLRPTAFGI
jgi:O-antigen/teichoic acid export membrane protein